MTSYKFDSTSYDLDLKYDELDLISYEFVPTSNDFDLSRT